MQRQILWGEGSLSDKTWALKAMQRAVKAMQLASDSVDLCQRCCNAIIEDSPYPLAWIGFAVPDEACHVDIVAKAGPGLAYLDGLEVSWADEPTGRGPAGTAIRTGTTQILNDVIHSDTFGPWAAKARSACLASVISIPLTSDARCIGVLLIYSEHRDAFDAETAPLLESLAGLIGLGINLHRATADVAAERQQSSAIQDQQIRTLRLLNLIVNTSNDTIFAKGVDGRYLLCNQEHLRQTGRKSDEVIGHKDDELFSSEQAERIMQRDRSVLELGHPITFEEEIITVDGLRTFTTTKGPLQNTDGEVFGLFGISRDITAQKRNVVALQESEARYRRFAEELSMGIVITQDGLIKYVNQSTADMIGYPSHELVGNSFLPYVCELDRPRVIEQHQRRMRGEHVDTPFILGMLRKDGSVRQWQFHTSTIEWDGKLSGMAIMADITEKIVADDMLRTAITEKNLALQRALDNETRYKTFIQHAADALFIHDLDARIVEVNQQACDNLGYTQDELCRMTLPDIVPGFDLLVSRALWERIVLGKPVKFTSTHRRKDGSTFPVELRIAKLEIHGQILLMALASDISARLHAENVLLDSFRKLEEKELSKTRFLAAAGHDLRQPIAAANLFVDTLKHTSPTSLQSDLIEKLDQSMQVFSNQLERLLDISKLDAGVIKPVLGSYDLHELFIWLEQTFSSQAHDKQLRFRMASPANRRITVKTDIGLLQSILMNLVSNAIKYTSHGGILISMRPRRDTVLLQVWDTGIGIAEENIHKIFDEFYQVANPQRNRESGLGLGLSIGQRAMSLLGGHITCRSRPGHGSVFSLQVPISKDSQHVDVMPTATVADPQAWKDRFKGKRVIILEDDALVANALSALMTSVGAQVSHFQSSMHALQHEDTLKGDFFIVDHSLGGPLSGLEFLQALQQKRQERLCAVIITGETSSSFISLASDAPWPVLHKPVTFETIALHLLA